jgi:hypothetical protein
MPPARRPRSRQTASRPRPLPDVPDPRQPRSCTFCGSPRAWFGYGPPLTPKMTWVCREHRAVVDPESVLPEWLR